MNCRRAKTLIFDFIDGSMNEPDRVALEQHLGACQSCESVAAGLRRSLDLLHRTPIEQPDENFTWKVRLAIAKERHSMVAAGATHGVWVRSWNTRFVLSAVSTFVVVMATGFFAGRGFVTSGDTPGTLTPLRETTAQSSPAIPVDRFLPGINFVGPTAVSTDGEPTAARGQGMIEEVAPMDADSLVNYFRGSQLERLRARALEEQVKMLQGELRECEGHGN